MFKLRDYQEKSKKDTYDFIFESNHKKFVFFLSNFFINFSVFSFFTENPFSSALDAPLH